MFKKKKEKNVKIDNSDFRFGVADIFKSDDSENIVVVGKVIGTVNTGAQIKILNFGDDKAQTFTSEVIGIDNIGKRVNTVSDCTALLMIKNGTKYNIKAGTVIYTENQKTDDFFDIYSGAIMSKLSGPGFGPDDADSLSISDCAEIISIEQNMVSKSGNKKAGEEFGKRLEWLAPVLKNKILDSEYIYCLYSTVTGDPYMESRVYMNGDEYIPEPPVVILITEAFLPLARMRYSMDKFKIVKIENGENKDGILKLLGEAFYINGAVGAAVHYADSVIASQLFISREEYLEKYPLSLPLSNPALARCVLLLSQISANKGEESETMRIVYRTIMTNVIEDAELLAPVKSDSADSEPELITKKGHDGKDALPLFTDIKHLQNVYGEEYTGYKNSISFFAEKYDIMIDPSKKNPEGCYIDMEMFSKMVEK